MHWETSFCQDKTKCLDKNVHTIVVGNLVKDNISNKTFPQQSDGKKLTLHSYECMPLSFWGCNFSYLTQIVFFWCNILKEGRFDIFFHGFQVQHPCVLPRAIRRSPDPCLDLFFWPYFVLAQKWGHIDEQPWNKICLQYHLEDFWSLANRTKSNSVDLPQMYVTSFAKSSLA